MTYSEAHKKIDAQIKQIDADIHDLYQKRMELCDELRFCDYTLEELESLIHSKRYELEMMEHDDTFGLVLRQRQAEIYIDKLKEQIKKRKGN